MDEKQMPVLREEFDDFRRESRDDTKSIQLELKSLGVTIQTLQLAVQKMDAQNKVQFWRLLSTALISLIIGAMLGLAPYIISHLP